MCLINRAIRRWFSSNCSDLVDDNIFLFRRCLCCCGERIIGGSGLERCGTLWDIGLAVKSAPSPGILLSHFTGSDWAKEGILLRCWFWEYGRGADTRFSISSKATGGEWRDREIVPFPLRTPIQKKNISKEDIRFF